MGRVIADISMSLDGFVTAPGGGTPLFADDGVTVALHQTDVVVTPYATHLTYQVGG